LKEIKFGGVDVKDRLSAKVVGGEEVKVSKISTVAMLFETTSKLNINGHYRFQVICGNKNLTLAAKVRNVLWKGKVEKNKRQSTLYQVAVDFENLKDETKAFFDSMIEQLIESDVPKIHDEVRGTKFHIKD